MPSTRRGECGARCKKTGSEHSKRPRHCALPARLRRTMFTGSSFRYRTESRSTEDTWQRTMGPSCRPHESTTDAGVSLTRSLSDSGPVPISPQSGRRSTSRANERHHARCLHGAADIVIRFGSWPPRFRIPSMRSASSVQPPIVGQIGTHGSCGSTGVGRRWRCGPPCNSIGSVTRCTRRCRGCSSGRRSKWCSMRLPQGQPNEAQSECLTRRE